MTHRFRPWIYALLVAGAVATTVSAADVPAGGPPLSLRLSATEYRNAISDIFGADIAIRGRFEPAPREEGLLAVGARSARVTADGIDLYDTLARDISAQVVEPQRRQTLFPCQPRDAKKSDDACARSLFASTGRVLFRRSLDDNELAKSVEVARQIAENKGDFYAGISAVLSEMLLSPQFLYRIRASEPDPAQPGRSRLDAHSRASVLSFYLWGTTPDTLLLDAAEKGDLYTRQGLERQVDRMISSPSVEGGVRAFFSDMLGFDAFEVLSKDPKFFPRFTQKVIGQAQEQTLRTIVDHVVRGHKDYRDLFTTRETFMTRPLAAVYQVPITDKGDNAQPDRWVRYTFPEGDPRAGLLSQISFVALHSPAARTSPTLRGKALRELLMCQTVPAPPGNVDFTQFQENTGPSRTTRERLTAHATQPMCAGCHKITDPIGLALENFDSGGGYRTQENGAQIDARAEIGGKKFEGAAGLSKFIRDEPAITSCVATRSFAFGAGFSPDRREPAWLEIEQRFKDSGYNVIELMRQIAMSELLYTVPSSATVTETAR